MVGGGGGGGLKEKDVLATGTLQHPFCHEEDQNRISKTCCDAALVCYFLNYYVDKLQQSVSPR